VESITIGMATIGQAPRDDVVPAMRQYLPAGIEIVERGALDGLTRDVTRPYWAAPGEVGIVTKLRDGSSVLLSHAKILPAMQAAVDRLVRDDGASLTVVLCGADWSALRSERLVINPGTLFPAVIASLAAGRRLGIIKPDAGQVEKERARYAALGIDATVTAASPYVGPGRLDLAREAAEQLRAAECELVWMTCVGMGAAMRDIVAEVTGVPVVLAHALLARVVTELLEGARGGISVSSSLRITPGPLGTGEPADSAEHDRLFAEAWNSRRNGR
jgi:protein AroM